MTRSEKLDILTKCWGDVFNENGISANILLSNVPEDITREEFIAHADAFKLRHKPSWRLDDDEYWLGQNPFDKRWHLYALQSGCGGWPKQPCAITVEYPTSFDEEF